MTATETDLTAGFGRTVAWLRAAPQREEMDQGALALAYPDRIDSETHPRGHPYPEATGYGLSVLVDLAANGREARGDLELRRAMAAFLEALLAQHGSVGAPRREPVHWSGGYTFDTGMALKGLAAHYMDSGDQPGEGFRAGLVFLDSAMRADGEIRPFGNSPFASASLRWSTRPGPYLLKALYAQVVAYRAVHGRYPEPDVADRALRWASSFRDRDGFFQIEPRPRVNMHAHLYMCEAAAMFGAIYDSATARQTARTGVEAALTLMMRAGRLPPTDNAMSHPTERCDTVAQLLRLCRMLEIGDARAHRLLLRRLLAYQSPEGGFRFGWDFDWASGRPLEVAGHLSSHTTTFAAQALQGMLSATAPRRWLSQPWSFA